MSAPTFIRDSPLLTHEAPRESFSPTKSFKKPSAHIAVSDFSPSSFFLLLEAKKSNNSNMNLGGYY